MPLGEGGRVEFPVRTIIDETELEGDMDKPPLVPVGMAGELSVEEEVTVTLPDAGGTPVEGLNTVLVDPGKVEVEKTVGSEDRTPVPGPTGIELFAIEILDEGVAIDETGCISGELIVLGLKVEKGIRIELTLPVRAGSPVEEPVSPRGGAEMDGLPMGPADEDLTLALFGLETDGERPLERVEERGTTKVPLFEGAGMDDEAGGAVGTPVVGGIGAPEEEGVKEDEGRFGSREPVEKVGEGTLPVDDIVMLGLCPKVEGLTV